MWLRLDFVAIVCLFLPSLSFGLPWFYTMFYEVRTQTVKGLTLSATTYPGKTYSWTRQVHPTADVEELSRTTYTRQDTIVKVILPASAAGTQTPTPHGYAVELEFTPPASCSATAVVTAVVRLNAPKEMGGALTPTATSTIQRTETVSFAKTTQTRTSEWVAELVNLTDVPEADLRSISRWHERTATLFPSCPSQTPSPGGIPRGCQRFEFRVSGSAVGGGYKCGGSYHYTWGLRPWGLALIILSGWFAAILALGIAESWRSFAALMNGREAKRGLPTTWCCLLPIVFAPLLFFSKSGFEARQDDTAELERKWKEMPPHTRLWLWLKWGFRYKYPPFLGSPPPKASSSSTSEPTQTQPEPVTPMAYPEPSQPRGPILAGWKE
ncbi:hypothetical protein AJ80_01882 [Polytolypa hystricis UAMH7299]|uniref:Uncharacterized protein n=1 Tax=Polytolypa hystricis (strain UAMH7299) TaxID=1447883 RepID=A0A2B7YQV0_POLH7|nr:hypothetical protein AJ80_01882 [Polytolypa hystricis UAMH7299]